MLQPGCKQWSSSQKHLALLCTRRVLPALILHSLSSSSLSEMPALILHPLSSSSLAKMPALIQHILSSSKLVGMLA